MHPWDVINVSHYLLLLVTAALLPSSTSSSYWGSDSLQSGDLIYKCNGVQVNPPSNLINPIKDYARCCNAVPFDARTHGCCASSILAYTKTRTSSDYSSVMCCGNKLVNDDEVCCGGTEVQLKKKGFKDCCTNSTKGVCDDELGCWSSVADCGIQSIGGPVGLAYGAASAVTSIATDKSISQWFIESTLLEDVPESGRRVARNNFDMLARAPNLAGNDASLSEAWKKRAINGANRVSQVSEIVQFAKKFMSGEVNLGTTIKHYVTMLDSEKDNIANLIDKQMEKPKLSGNKFLGGLKTFLRRLPFACIAVSAIDCGSAYLPSVFRGKRHTQIKQRLSDAYYLRETYKLLYVAYDLRVNQLLETIQAQELASNPYLATSALMEADGYWNLTLDGTTVAEILLSESDQFFNILKRAIQPNSERGVQIGYQERNDLLAASKNHSMATQAIAFLTYGIDEFMNSGGQDGFITTFRRRLRNLDLQINNLTLNNMHQFVKNFNSTLVDMKSAVILTKQDGTRIYAGIPIVPSSNTSTPLFVTFLPLPSQYEIQSVVRVSRHKPPTLVMLHKVPEGVMFPDVYDDDKLTYFFTVKPAVFS